ncbi:hypothetical protein L4C37_10665 [Vibrio kagoshimensis]|uniref:zonular occludens toxin domain-containing protein n=1 Tax=Vibrio kagoshimensis TaxID=2910244 RepID=UPI003D1BF9BC
MPVYFVTGKLGNGKSLTAVGRIREALERGVPVATNLNINLKSMFNKNIRSARLLRVPDKPTLPDLLAIGKGNKTYDERKNGLLVLDECGTWFNSRTWNDKSRAPVINWLLHARKLGWDVIFIVQDIAIVDKQARLALGEHLVICRRFDRMKIPIVSNLIKLISFGVLKGRLPKIHMGIVKYGDNAQAITVDKWWVFGTSLFWAYDTKQAFVDHLVVPVTSAFKHPVTSDFLFTDKTNHGTAGVYSVLPPYYTHGRYSMPLTMSKFMRLTKIYLKKWSRPMAFTFGFAVAVSYFLLIAPPVDEEKITQVESAQSSGVNLSDLLAGYSIKSFMNAPNTSPYFELVNKGELLTSNELQAMGFELQALSRCNVTVQAGKQSQTVYCK